MASGSPFGPSTQAISTSLRPRFFNSVNTASQNFAPSFFSIQMRVNPEKSAVDRPWNRKFLGYSMTCNRKPRLKAAPRSVERLRT